MPSQKLYEEAIEITTDLKDKAREQALGKRIEERKAREEKQKKAEANRAGKAQVAAGFGDDAQTLPNVQAVITTAPRTSKRKWFNRTEGSNHVDVAEVGEAGLQESTYRSTVS